MAMSLALVANCAGNSEVIECETDEECPDDKPVCDTSGDPKVCVPASDECSTDLQCQATDSGGDDVCEGPCPDASDACIEGTDGEGHCVLLEGGGCGEGFEAVEAEDHDGATVSVCVDTAVGCNEGTCE
jgi:hypothetical protein